MATPSVSYRPRIRRLSLGVKGVLVLVALFGIWLSWVAYHARTRRNAIATIRFAGGRIGYDWQWSEYNPHLGRGARVLRWLRGLVGDDSLGHPNFVELGDIGSAGSSLTLPDGSLSTIKRLSPYIRRLTRLEIVLLYRSDVTDDDLANLGDLSCVKDLDLAGTRITDAGLIHLKRMTNLQSLNLNRTAVTDEGLKNLEGLTGLTWLGLRGTAVTEAGAGALSGFFSRLNVDR